MQEKTIKNLKNYYYISFLNSYIFSDNLSEKLKQRNIVDEKWFIDYMSTNIIYYSEFDVLGEQERDNCFTMLNQFLLNSIDKKNIDMISICNYLIRTLNSCSDINREYFLKSLYINSSINPKLQEKRIRKNDYNFDYFKRFFYYSSITAAYLIKEKNEDLGYELIANEFYFNSIIDIINAIPNILQDEEVFVKMMHLLYCNNAVTIKGEPLFLNSPKTAITNQKTKIYLKKAYKSANSYNKKKNL